MRNTGTYGKGAKGKADKLFSLIIRSAGRCAACGDNDYRKLQCAHIVSRRYSVTRTDEDNAVALCWGCHRRFTDDPFAWVTWVYGYMGEEAYEALRVKARDGVGTKVDWSAEADRLAAIWKRIEGRAA